MRNNDSNVFSLLLFANLDPIMRESIAEKWGRAVNESGIGSLDVVSWARENELM